MTDRERVYVVDDDASFRRGIQRLMAVSGFEVLGFASPLEFLAVAPAQGPACVLLDLRLPGLNGLEVQASLARAARTMPIIFLTGHGTVPECAKAMQAGALEFFQKPVDGQDLIAAVRRALEVSRNARTADEEQRAIRMRLETLTRREAEVASLVVTGMLNKQIAFELGTAEKTVKVHRARVMGKMAAKSVADLVHMFHKLGLESAGSDRHVGPKPN